MTLAMVIPKMDFAGAEAVVATVAMGLVKRGHGVHVLSAGGGYVAEIEAAGVTHHTTQFPDPRQGLGAVAGVATLKNQLQAIGPDLINVHAFYPLPQVYGARKLGRLKAVLAQTVHIPEKRSYYAVMGPSLRWMVKDVSTVAQHTLDELHQYGLPKPTGRVIYNGIRRDLLRPIDEINAKRCPEAGELLRLGTLSRLIERKGLQDLLRALKILSDRGHRFQLDIAGRGDYRNTLEQLVTELGLSKQVVFHGERRDLANYLDTLDLYILPSHFEGLPMSMLEAMARGVPAMCTAVNGVPEVITHGETGFLIPPKNVEVLVQTLEKVFNDPSSLPGLRQLARQRVEQGFLTECMVDGYEQWFETLVRSSS